MTGDGCDIGFVLTKGPVETGLVEGALRTAVEAMASGNGVGFFLISDGVWLAKRGADNTSSRLFTELLTGGASATASRDHLLASGISEDDILDGVDVARKTYPELVDHVMDSWNRVVVI